MLDVIYSALPKSLQNAALSLYGARINSKRYDACFERAFSNLIANDFKSKQEIENHQELLFVRLIDKIKASKLGKARFEYLYGNIDGFRSIDDLKNIPITSKQKVKEALKIFPINKKSQELVCHTSGTTGSGLVFPAPKMADAYQWAVWWRYRNRHGISLNTVCGYFGGRSIVPLSERKCFYRYNRPANQVMFSAYHLNRETVSNYIIGLQRNNVSWLHGYPSFLSHFAGIVEELGISLKGQIKVITIGAESLLCHQKRLLERVFGCCVRQHYGMAEGVANISEDENGDLVVDEDFSYCEFVNNDCDSQQSKIIGTSLFNSAMPFLRYDTGDLATLTSDYDIARKVIEIDGRREDALILKDGTKICRLDHVFKDIVDVKEVQLQQDNVESMRVLVVKGDSYGKHIEKKILEELKERLKVPIKIDFVYVDKIPRTKSGKLRFVVSNIKGRTH